jgi:transposase-like protein
MNVPREVMWAVLADENCLSAIKSFMRTFSTDESCRRYLEARLWPDGPVCPHCSGGKRVYRIRGKTARNGLYTCGACRKQFTVTLGTIFERSHIPLPNWFLGILFVVMWPEGITAHNLQRMVGISYRSAWSMRHKVQRAMRMGIPDDILLLGCKPKHRTKRE